ncbi:MAG TPA: hypothetical protein VF857_06925 [Spirochaetota bacterium]
MERQTQFNKRQIARYSKWAATAVQHSVPLDAIICATRDYHGDAFASAVEKCVKDSM